MSVPVVVGAYPEPFRRGTTSVVAVGADAGVARAIAGQVHGVVAATKPTKNFIVISSRFKPGVARIKRFRKGVLLELGVAAARRLAADRTSLRYRYGDAK
jgi:hypothetical protein